MCCWCIAWFIALWVCCRTVTLGIVLYSTTFYILFSNNIFNLFFCLFFPVFKFYTNRWEYDTSNPKSHLPLINLHGFCVGKGWQKGGLYNALTGGVESCTLSFVAFLAISGFTISFSQPLALWCLGTPMCHVTPSFQTRTSIWKALCWLYLTLAYVLNDNYNDI